MPQALILFGEEEDKIIEAFSREWKLSKVETVKRIVQEYGRASSRESKGGRS